MPGSQKCSSKNFCKIPFSTRLKVLSSFRITRDQDTENKNGFAAERLWFLGHKVESLESTPFDTKMFEMFLKFHEKQFVTHRARFHPS